MRLHISELVATLALAILLAPLAASAQQARKMSRIGILGDKASDPAETRLWQISGSACGSTAGGGENMVIEHRWAEGNPRGSRTRGGLGAAPGGPDRGAELHVCAARERGDLLDPHCLRRACRSRRHRPRREPCQARREHQAWPCCKPTSVPKGSSSCSLPSRRPSGSPCCGIQTPPPTPRDSRPWRR